MVRSCHSRCPTTVTGPRVPASLHPIGNAGTIWRNTCGGWTIHWIPRLLNRSFGFPLSFQLESKRDMEPVATWNGPKKSILCEICSCQRGLKYSQIAQKPYIFATKKKCVNTKITNRQWHLVLGIGLIDMDFEATDLVRKVRRLSVTRNHIGIKKIKSIHKTKTIKYLILYIMRLYKLYISNLDD